MLRLRQKAEGTKAEEKARLLRRFGGERRFAPTYGIYQRLEREIHGLLADLGLMQQRTDEFVDQEELVQRFIKEWVKIIKKIEDKVVKQVEAGKTKVKV